MTLHIGQKIREVAKEKRIGTVELANLIHTSRQNLDAIYKKNSIDSHQLFLISKALEFDFFALYTKQLLEQSEGISHAQYVKGLHSAAGLGEDGRELEKCKGERERLGKELSLQTENSVTQSKLIRLLEDKIKSFEQKV